MNSDILTFIKMNSDILTFVIMNSDKVTIVLMNSDILMMYCLLYYSWFSVNIKREWSYIGYICTAVVHQIEHTSYQYILIHPLHGVWMLQWWNIWFGSMLGWKNGVIWNEKTLRMDGVLGLTALKLKSHRQPGLMRWFSGWNMPHMQAW